ncbi:histidine kinase [Cognatitamlana onchidii]|uniref:histidine kinase n=1 Tax=Cognatitamlana onchidii TaxID=2562860 RepID=UPI0010A64AF7|nr:histidine kinase [Algibacter onchidii]
MSIRYLLGLLMVLNTFCLLGQPTNFQSSQASKFTIKGSVVEQDTEKPISNVNVEISGGQYTTTDAFGEFRIVASRGDELIIRHVDFETVYYTIKGNEDIKVEVAPIENDELEYSKSTRASKVDKTADYKTSMDSAKYYLKKDAKKGIQFVGDAISNSNTSKQNATAYEVLGDIFSHWEQYDLAVTNYRISLQNLSKTEVIFKLASAYKNNQNYQESLEAYSKIKEDRLSNGDLVNLYEGLGDVHLLIKDYKKAISIYQKALKIAQDNEIIPKITDLNSRIAQAYNASGETQNANIYFNKSMELANSQNKKRSVEEKLKVADFKGENNDFSNEIKLRKQALTDLEDLNKDSIFSNESILTPQKQNYKIGRAYASQQDYGSAIPYLKKSIIEADNREDLLVQKDATRKLSEVYRDAGDYDKALLAYQDYVELVDKLYVLKEQQIFQAARFSKDIASKQNRILSLEGDRALSESKYQLSQEQSKRQKLIIYSLIGGVCLLLVTAFFMFKYIKEQRLANNLLALRGLRSQMNPHFIFNALNSVNSFIASSDERTANKYLTDFSLLMRAVLENSEEDFISLEKEIELLQLYIKLEHFRFQDKFEYHIIVDENIKTREFVIPPMLLQPYIENAVWHGLRYKKNKGILEVKILETKGDEIKIIITDNGIGREKSQALKTAHQEKHKSKGMGNIKKRVAILNDMYKGKVDVEVADLNEDVDIGTKVTVTLKKN